MPTSANTLDGCLLDVPEGASPDEIEPTIAWRDAEDRRNRDALRRMTITNDDGPGWPGWQCCREPRTLDVTPVPEPDSV